MLTRAKGVLPLRIFHDRYVVNTDSKIQTVELSGAVGGMFFL